MTRPVLHVCDDACTCPVHGTPWWFAPASGEHACQDIDCVHGRGLVLPGPLSVLVDGAAAR